MTTLQMIRNMSWGVKGIRYSVEQLNKTIANEGLNKYGVQYPVVNKRIATFSGKSSRITNERTRDTATNSYKSDNYKNSKNGEKGKIVKENFAYTSNNNSHFLSINELKKLV